jgi:signal transduction histidine kinase
LRSSLLDESGLLPALREYTEGLSTEGDIKVQLVIDDDFERPPAALETAIFRIVRECLTNVHRHSGSKTAAIRIFRS